VNHDEKKTSCWPGLTLAAGVTEGTGIASRDAELDERDRFTRADSRELANPNLTPHPSRLFLRDALP